MWTRQHEQAQKVHVRELVIVRVVVIGHSDLGDGRDFQALQHMAGVGHAVLDGHACGIGAGAHLQQPLPPNCGI